MDETMSNPPVFYTLIQVRFNRVSQMHSFVPAFQEALRKKGYPDYREESQLEVQIVNTPSGQQSVEQHRTKRWIFNDLIQTRGFVLLEDSLVYQTTAYTRFTDCRGHMLEALALLHEQLGIAYVQRVGMRYLDAIQPDDTYKLTELVLPELLGLSQRVAGELKHSYSETVQTIDDSTLVMKTFVSSQSVPLPPDLQMLSLQLPDSLVKYRGQSMVMDSDCFYEKRFEFDCDAVGTRVDRLHAALLGLFKESITEEASRLWDI